MMSENEILYMNVCEIINACNTDTRKGISVFKRILTESLPQQAHLLEDLRFSHSLHTLLEDVDDTDEDNYAFVSELLRGTLELMKAGTHPHIWYHGILQ
jgi:hypothetical protein